MSDILVVGSLAYDTISTPTGRAPRTLGGSANYFSLAASHFSTVRVIGVVGEDYSAQDMKILSDRGVDVSGLQKEKGKTFHWEGKYQEDMNEAITVETALNVFQHFDPRLDDVHKNCQFVFLANIDPDLQLKVLDQVSKPKLVASDTMNFWIESKKDSLLKVIERVDFLSINEGEARQLTRTTNAVAAAREIMKMGPKACVIKRGEYGFVLLTQEGYHVRPAFPIADVVDPTGAGDSFAGGLIGFLAKNHKETTLNPALLRQACLYGTLIASFTVQDFGLKRLQALNFNDIEKRRIDYEKVVQG